MLLRNLDHSRFDVTVAPFYAKGFFWSELTRIDGLNLTPLDKRGRWDIVKFYVRCVRLVKRIRPAIIYSFAQEPNLIALPLAKFVSAKTVWGIRRSTKSVYSGDAIALFGFVLGRILSPLADSIIYNSWCGRDLYNKRGYCSLNALVVSNGFDTTQFRPSSQERLDLRAELGLHSTALVVGIVGRIHPVKNHAMFLRMAQQLLRKHPGVRFICVGSGTKEMTESVHHLAASLELEKVLIWLGEQSNMTRVYNVLDTLVLCSKEEGCPNVVGEAMSCGIPCVVFDVGDAAQLVGNTGLVVKEGDEQELVSAVSKLVDMDSRDRQRLGGMARQRIESEFGLDSMVLKVTSLFEGLAT